MTGTVVVAGGIVSELDYIADDPLHTTARPSYTMVGDGPPVAAPLPG